MKKGMIFNVAMAAGSFGTMFLCVYEKVHVVELPPGTNFTDALPE